LAAAVGLAVGEDDLLDVTYRLNAFLRALASLAALPLDDVEPIPIEPEVHR